MGRVASGYASISDTSSIAPTRLFLDAPGGELRETWISLGPEATAKRQDSRSILSISQYQIFEQRFGERSPNKTGKHKEI
jgi:hypothetical protein